MKIAICQAAMRQTIHENLDTIESMCRDAAKDQAGLVVFPECMLTGFHRNLPTLCKEDILNDAFSRIQDLATQLNLGILCGTPFLHNDKIFNSVVLFEPPGKKNQRYDKIGLTDSEARYFSPGNKRMIMQFNGYQLGIILCREILDIASIAADYEKQGIDLLIWPGVIQWHGDPANKEYIGDEQWKRVVASLQCPLLHINAANFPNNLATRNMGSSFYTNGDGNILMKAAYDDEELIIFNTSKTRYLEDTTSHQI